MTKRFASNYFVLRNPYFVGMGFYIIGGSRGGAAAPPTPPTGSISFVFAYVFAKKCTHRRLVPPQRVGAPPQREILDPPLYMYITSNNPYTGEPLSITQTAICVIPCNNFMFTHFTHAVTGQNRMRDNVILYKYVFFFILH